MKKNNKKKVFIEEDFIDIDILLPTKEEMEKTLKHIIENRDLTIEDMIVLKKMKLVKMIKNCKGVKI